eukprot:TCONS_00004350-protein
MRVFCSKADNNERKYELKSYLQNNKSKRQSKQEESPKTSSKRLHLSWEHFDRQKNKFAIVKAEKGGGSRSEKFSKDTTKQELFNYCVTIFWTGRRKEHFPNECHMIIADYKHDPIPDIYHGNPFTFGGYLDLYKMARPRIFFQTKPKIFSASLPIATPPSHHYRPESRRSLEAPEVLADTSQSSTSPNTTPNRPMNNSDLNARRALIEEQNKAYEEALLIDQRKEKEAEEALRYEEELEFRNERIRIEEQQALLQEEERLKQLRQSRLSRVPPELSLEDEHVVVAVRHPTLKTQTRFFKPDSSMTAVYDWIGSLSLRPEHFNLYNAERRIVPPSLKIETGVYNMNEVDHEILMSPTGTVAFRGFGTLQDPPTNQSSLPTVQAPLSNRGSLPTGQDPPLNRASLPTGQDPPLDFGSSPTNKNPLQLKDGLEEKRKEALQELIDDSFSGTLIRDDIYNSFIKLYSEEKPDLYQRLVLKLENEKASGYGVAKDAFSCFFDELKNRFEGSREIVPHSRLKDAEVIGRIITHSFILFQMFPIMLSRATMKYYLFGTVNTTELLESFFNFLPEREEITLSNFNEKSASHTTTATRILSEFNIFESPKEANLTRLCQEAAHVALVQAPCFQMQSIVRGMSFFKNLSPLLLEEIYVRSKPSSEAIIENLLVNEESNHEQRIITWLHRYISACNENELSQLLRFITASASMMTNSKIKVIFCNLPVDYLKPGSQTCFGILYIPRQYSSFTQLTNNFNKYIQNYTPSQWQLEDDDNDE